VSVISVENVGKRYRVGELEAGGLLRDKLASALRNPAALLRRSAREEFWALRDISFEVKEGEVLGLIGRNGAGKSTLLKILSRITAPTVGHARIRGRCGSLLEVGTGFHPELTGRENVFLNGAILGMSKREIARKFDEIVAFAEIDRFIDTPVKRYSSGMYVRLAFAVAAHLETEILFVDEVLAVGDAQFQKKCLGKMGDVARHGRTIIFVSHNMTAVRVLCPRALWLEQGAVLQDGPGTAVISAYLARSIVAKAEQCWSDVGQAPGNEIVRIRKMEVRPLREAPANGEMGGITVRTPLVMEFEYWKILPQAQLSLSIHVFDADGARAFATFPPYDPIYDGASFGPMLVRSRCYIPGDLLNAGTYRLLVLVVRDRATEVFRIEDGLAFDVREARSDNVGWHGSIPGVVRPALKWETEVVEEFAGQANASLPGSKTGATV
jgi:homopolymeric O-antigen transport system ATP-binding protein